MNSILAVLAYSLAIGIPIWLLHHFGAQAWYWHVLALAAAFGIGMIPMPPAWQGPELDLTLGFGFLLLLAWGIGGLMVTWRHHERHA